jgi:hypothetical protein
MKKINKLYQGKLFYLLNPDGTIDGPRNDIYYVSASGKKTIPTRGYKFAQVINGLVKQVFTNKDVLVLKNGKQVS